MKRLNVSSLAATPTNLAPAATESRLVRPPTRTILDRQPLSLKAGWTLLFGLLLGGSLAQADDILPNNIWPNATLESVSSTPGLPTHWNRGGSDTAIDQWAADTFLSTTHSLKLEDTTQEGYGEWYSERISAVAGADYFLRYHLIYETDGSMRLSVNFADASGANLSSITYNFSGSQPEWETLDQTFTAPDTAATLWFTFASGGSVSTTGTAYLDDISLVNDSGQPVDTNASNARVVQAAYAANLAVDGNPADWAGLGSGVITMDTQGRGSNGAMAVDIRYAWDTNNLYILVTENTQKYTASVKHEGANATAYQSGPWSLDSIAFWIDLDNNAGTVVDGITLKEANADFQPWFGFSSSGRTDLIYARRNNSDTLNLDALANAQVATGGTFTQHDRAIEVALRWADLAAAVDVSRQPGSDLLQAIAPGYVFGSEPLLVYHDYNSQAFLGPDQWNAPNGVDTNSVDIKLAAAVPVSTPPTLTISAGAPVQIRWPVTAEGYTLETSAQLGASASWSTVPNAPTTNGTMNQVALTPTGNAAFYRLRK